jgi:hypothetical protein
MVGAEKSGSSKEDAGKMHFEKSITPSEACKERQEKERATVRNRSRLQYEGYREEKN